MSIDTNDVKIVVNSSFNLVMKSCWQCVKGQPVVCVFLLLLLFVYLYLPSWFNVLIYTSPLAICTAIFLQQLLRFGRQNTRTMKPYGENEKATTETQNSTRDSGALRKKLRPTVQAAMSRRTFKKRTCEELGKIVVEDMKVDFIFGSLPDEMPAKLREAKEAHGSNDPVSLPTEKPEAPASDAAETDASRKIGCEVSKNDGESQKDDKPEAEPRHDGEKNKRVMEWTEEDKRNHMDLASSDVEWNKRLENLIASRRARKMFSMLPQRNPIDSVVADDLQGRVTPILTERDNSDNEGGQPGSAPSVLLPTNPFDIPYDPSEEKPILTGDGFGDEFMTTQPKDLLFCKHESFSYGHPYKSGSSVFSNPLASIGPGLPRFRRQSDARENIKQDFEQLFQEVKHKNAQSDCQEEASTSAEKNNESDVLSDEENVDPNGEDADSILSEPGNAIEEQGLDNDEEDEEERQSTLGLGSSVGARDELEMDPDLIEDDNDDRSSSSSSEEATADVANAVKNESFRNSVKKVLSVIQKNRGVPPLYPPPGSEPDDTRPRFSRPTKMEERSLYTRPSHHLSYSIASDMQVEVSEASSPPPMLNDGLNSPIDGESLDFDQDEDDSDEDLLGASTDPDRSEGSTPTSSREQPECSKQNLNNSQDANSDSTKSEEQTIFSPRKSISREFKETNKPGDFPEHQTSGVQQVAKESDAFPTERLQENVLMVGSASTNTEQNIDTYIHLPSNDLLSEDRENVYQDCGDYVPQRSLQASVSQPVELELVAEPEVIDLIPSPRCVLQETVSMDDQASINSEYKLNADIQPPTNAIGTSSSSDPSQGTVGPGPVTGSSSSPKSVLPEATPVREFESSCEPDINEYHRDEVENSSMSDAPQEDHQPDTLDEDSGSTRRSVNTASPRIPVASPLSATSALPQTAPLDEMELRSSDSMHSNVEPVDGVLVSRIPLHDLPLAEGGVRQDASTSLMNDQSGEKPDEKRLQDAVMEQIVSENADHDEDQTRD